MKRSYYGTSSRWTPQVLVLLATLTFLAGCGLSRDAFAPPGTVGGPSDDRTFHIIPVHFATDRARKTSPPMGVDYTGKRGDGVLEYGVAEVSVPVNHLMGSIERPRWWRLEFSEHPDRHIVVLATRTESREAFVQDLRQAISDRGRREALVFIHGYNTPFDEALRRTAQLSFDLRFAGATILYSWPSEGETFKYTVDEANIEWTAPHFEAFLRMVLKRISAERVHVVAHSMGNRALARALMGLDRDPPPESVAKLHQVVFAAPDVDADVFRRSALQFHDQADRITLYASSNDQALKASKSVHGYPRAGESGADLVVVEGIDTIDASLVETDFLGHSYFGDRESVISDLLNLIRESRPPSERPWLSPRQHAEARYWLFQP